MRLSARAAALFTAFLLTVCLAGCGVPGEGSSLPEESAPPVLQSEPSEPAAQMVEPPEWAGGVYDGEAKGCTYDPAKAGEWAVIDVINDRRATDYTGYDITVKQ